VAKFTDDDDALLSALGVEVDAETSLAHTPREERMLAGFEEIQRFVDEHGHAPRHGEERDIFERLYAVRLGRLCQLSDALALLKPLDRQGLLTSGAPPAPPPMDDDALLAELGVVPAGGSLTQLHHVRSAAEKRVADEWANRTPCVDFESFKPLLDGAARELKTGLVQSKPISAENRSIAAGDLFVLDGLFAYVAEVGEPFKKTGGEVDARLRVIYSNGTESNLLLRSLQRAFYEDPAARRLESSKSGQMALGDSWDEGDVESGTIYVLRSLSDDPYVAQHREVLHKIGVTGGKVETRIANAEKEATYLLAKVEIVQAYQLAGLNRTKMEKLFHKLFENARLDVTIKDRFGNPVEPREWFIVPLAVIDEAVQRIRDGSILQYVYDPRTASLVRAK
jgi:hypothetical protein